MEISVETLDLLEIVHFGKTADLSTNCGFVKKYILGRLEISIETINFVRSGHLCKNCIFCGKCTCWEKFTF